MNIYTCHMFRLHVIFMLVRFLCTKSVNLTVSINLLARDYQFYILFEYSKVKQLFYYKTK